MSVGSRFPHGVSECSINCSDSILSGKAVVRNQCQFMPLEQTLFCNLIGQLFINIFLNRFCASWKVVKLLSILTLLVCRAWIVELLYFSTNAWPMKIGLSLSATAIMLDIPIYCSLAKKPTVLLWKITDKKFVWNIVYKRQLLKKKIHFY